MNKKEKNKKQNQSVNVEFGMEFGDMNASKLYEIPFMSGNSQKRKEKKES